MATSFYRLVGVTVLLVAAGALALACLRSGPRTAGWAAAADDPVLERERQRRRRLQAEQNACHRLRGLKNRVAAGLIAGRLTLRQATAQYHDLCRQAPHYAHLMDFLRQSYPAASDDERLCRHLIDYIRYLSPGPDGAEAAAARRLEAQLEGSLRRQGAVPGSAAH